jgi:hypothetical protein
LLQLENPTPLKAAISVLPDANGVDTLFVAVKATLVLAPHPCLAKEQDPVHMADACWGEPGQSSLKFSGEFHLLKPSTDVLIVGSACEPRGRAVPQLEVRFRVGPLERMLRVSGERVWESGLFSYRPSAPQPFTSLPLRWERAFGGVHLLDPERGKLYAEARNPVGCGFVGKRDRAEFAGKPVPNLESPRDTLSKLGQQIEPVCFAPVAPAWLPRRKYAGTYDENWQRNRAPYLPADFDPRFFQAAPEGQIAPGPFEGGESVELVGLWRQGELRFALPTFRPQVEVRIAGATERPPLMLETVIFDTDRDVYSLAWRAALPCDKKVLKVERVRIDAKGLAALEAAA